MSVAFETVEGTDVRPLPVLWLDEGLYYAEVRHPASEIPIRVALHGIQTPQQACEALTVLARRECRVPRAV